MTVSPIAPPAASAEATRNALLRRVDWRHLLPDPHPGRVVRYGDGGLEAAMRAVAAEVVDGAGDRVGDAESGLAVAVDPDAATLRRALEALAPGGWLYVEWRRAGVTVGSARRRLESAGYEHVLALAPHPRSAADRPRQWVSVESRAAVRFALRGDPAPEGTIRRVRRAARNAVLSTLPRAWWRPPFSTLARKPQPRAGGRGGSAPGTGGGGRAGSGARDPSASALADRLRNDWTELGLGPAPARLAVSLLTGGRHSENKVIALVFPDGAAVPRLAIKMARVADSVPGLAREAAVLRAIGRRRPAVPGVPSILFDTLTGPVPMVGQTVVSGRPAYESLNARTAGEICGLATDWQLRLAAGASRGDAADLVARIVEPIVADFERCFGRAVDDAMLREAADEARSIGDLVRVPEQRDFSPWNVLIPGDGGIAVLDWESSVEDGLPGLDLIYFLTYVSVYLSDAFGSGEYESAYRRFLDRSTLVGGVAAECIDRYRRETGITGDDLRRLRLICWMLHSRSDHRHLVADTGRAEPPIERLRTSPFLRFWRTEFEPAPAG